MYSRRKGNILEEAHTHYLSSFLVSVEQYHVLEMHREYIGRGPHFFTVVLSCALDTEGLSWKRPTYTSFSVVFFGFTSPLPPPLLQRLCLLSIPLNASFLPLYCLPNACKSWKVRGRGAKYDDRKRCGTFPVYSLKKDSRLILSYVYI